MSQVVAFLSLAILHLTSGAPITADEVQAAQKEWSDGIINLATKQKTESVDYVRALADQFVDKLYAYTAGNSTVLLRSASPSDNAANVSFCLTRECAVAHVIAQSGNQSWNSARFENAGLILQDDMAMAMGSCFYTGDDAVEKRFEYSFGYTRDSTQKLRISLLHMSTPSNSSGQAVKPKNATNIVDVTEESKKATVDTVVDGKADVEQLASDANTIAATTSTTTTTTTTTTAAAAATTTAKVDDGHILHHHAGRPTKAPTQASSGSIIGSFVKVLVVILLLFSLALVAFTAQVKSRPGMSPSDKVAAGADIFQRKVQSAITGKKTLLPSSYDKNV